MKKGFCRQGENKSGDTSLYFSPASTRRATKALTSFIVRCEKLSASALAGDDTSAVRTRRTSRSRENLPRMGAEDILVKRALRARTHSSNLRAPAKRNVDW